jgi:hypothetical protein
MSQITQMIQDARMGFCAGLAVLAVQVPPHWSEWLAGELGEAQATLWVAAAAAVLRGILWAIFALAGVQMPAIFKRKDDS